MNSIRRFGVDHKPTSVNSLGINVLIVDENPTQRKLLRQILQAEGCGCIEAAEGAEALAVLERDQEEIIISEILIARIDGYWLCDALRKEPRFCHLPFVVYTDLSNGRKTLARYGRRRVYSKSGFGDYDR